MINSKEFAYEIRRLSLQMVFEAKASHIGGALSIADLLGVLYSDIIKVDTNNSEWDQRDRFLLSKGHACTSLYAALAIKGFYPVERLATYGKDGSDFTGHASHMVPGVELSTGSLGHALPIGCGIALAAKRKKQSFRTYVLTSDGELDEGSNWEAILFAPQYKLDNLIMIIDYNKIQSLGSTNDVINLEPLKKKFESFNWESYEIDGHNHLEIKECLLGLTDNGFPKAIIANTIKGKGIDFMENSVLWHYKSPSEDELENALNQLINKKL